jgi:hypothetical protein
MRRALGWGFLGAVGVIGATRIATPAPAAAEAPVAATTTACGVAPDPDCPLQAWMKGTAVPALIEADYDRLSSALSRVATMAPPGYTTWSEISRRGALAARARDPEGCRAACKACHDEHRARYRSELRDRPLP